tara:strand:- start:15947 stop:17050 length:1104 start_codon:yes stop_codon:yes gene_type:complete
MAQVKLLKWDGTSWAQMDTANDEITAGSLTTSGNIGAVGGTFSGNIGAVDGTFSGDVEAVNADLTGTLTGVDASFSAAVTGDVFKATNEVRSMGALFLNYGYTSDSFSAGYVVMIDDPSGTSADVQSITASVPATTDATVVVDTGQGASFSAGDLVILNGTVANDGLFEVQGVSSDTVTLKAGLSAGTFPFLQGSAVVQGSVQGTLQQVRISIIRSKSAGGFEAASIDSTSSITWSAMQSGSASYVEVDLEANGAIAVGDAVVLVSGGSANRVTKADASAIGTADVIGICMTSASSAGDAVTIRTSGSVSSLTGGGSFTVGDAVYLSTTAGTLTQTAPSTGGEVVMQVGIATGTDAMVIDPKTPIVL